MPRNCAVNLILEQNFRPMRSWKLRNSSGGAGYKLVRNVRKILNLLSGNRIVPMLKSVLRIEEKKELLNKHVMALNKISNVYNVSKQKQRFKLLNPMRHAGLSYKETRSLGFKATKYMWKSCLMLNERMRGGKPKIDDSIKSEIELHMESISHIAANRYLKREQTNAFYRDVPLTEAYTSFNLKDQITFTTFYKLV